MEIVCWAVQALFYREVIIQITTVIFRNVIDLGIFALWFGLTSETHENADNRLMRHTVCSMTNVAQSCPSHALYIQECEKTRLYPAGWVWYIWRENQSGRRILTCYTASTHESYMHLRVLDCHKGYAIISSVAPSTIERKERNHIF